MIAFKKKYFLIIESIKDINLRNIKKRNKFVIIYRNLTKVENIDDLIKFRRLCKSKNIEFFVTNNFRLAIDLKSDGLYLSSRIKDFKTLRFKKRNFKIIGSAHNIKEIHCKKRQGCEYILLSRLFQVSYKPQMQFLDIIKFNNFIRYPFKKLIPLGGIKLSNLNKLKIIMSNGFAIMTEIKKKPAISSRLF